MIPKKVRMINLKQSKIREDGNKTDYIHNLNLITPLSCPAATVSRIFHSQVLSLSG